MMTLVTGPNEQSFSPKVECTLLLATGRKRLQPGFTLVEMLCVIVIIAILFTLSIPTIAKTARNFYFKNKVKQVTSLLKHLKKTAAIEERYYKFVVDFANNSYSVYTVDRQNNTNYTDDFFLVKDTISGSRSLAKGLSFRGETQLKENQEIIFDPSGTLTAQKFFICDQNKHIAGLTTTLSGEIIMEFIQ